MPGSKRCLSWLTRRMVKPALVGRGRVLGKSDGPSNYRDLKEYVASVSVVLTRKYTTPGN